MIELVFFFSCIFSIFYNLKVKFVGYSFVVSWASFAYFINLFGKNIEEIGVFSNFRYSDDSESQAHLAFVDIVIVPFNIVDAKGFFTISLPTQVYTTPSIRRGSEHSALLKVKYHRLQQLSQL